MAFITIPNVSEGRDRRRIDSFRFAAEVGGAHVLDVHSDARHNRSVLTVAGSPEELLDGMTALAAAGKDIDLAEHEGVHPRLGGLDVCPVVPYGEPMAGAVQLARRIGREIAMKTGLPVFLYGDAARRPGVDLPAIRRGGLAGLSSRAASEMPVDFGPQKIDRRFGVVCVGARRTLVAFNTWLDGDVAVARSIATKIRESSGGMPGVRALGLPMGDRSSQVSMNLIDPQTTGIDDVFPVIERAATDMGATIRRTELVGLIPQRFMPHPGAPAARLLIEPGRTLEQALRSVGYLVD